jgi:hypothetical protein
MHLHSTTYMSEEEDVGLTSVPGDVGADPIDELMGTLIGKLKTYCPNLFCKLSLWERDYLENSTDLNFVTTSALSTFTTELSSASLRAPASLETPSAPSCAIRQPPQSAEALPPSSPTITPPLSSVLQGSTAPLAVDASPNPSY